MFEKAPRRYQEPWRLDEEVQVPHHVLELFGKVTPRFSLLLPTYKLLKSNM